MNKIEKEKGTFGDGRFRFRVLVDNNTYIDQYFLGEPAVSYYIEIDGRKILFDTGYSGILLDNAVKMGVDLGGLSHIVLSHGHNDHTKGLAYLANAFDLSDVELIAHPDCFSYRETEGEEIGAPFTAAEIARICRYRPQTGPCAVTEHCVYLGEIPQKVDFEPRRQIGEIERSGENAPTEEAVVEADGDKQGIYLTQDLASDLVPDLVSDDSALAIKTSEGLFIVTGCSHSGICNIAEYAKEVCGEERISGIIGGFHLFETDGRLKKTIQYFADLKLRNLYPCHCVSLKAKAEMMKILPQVQEVGVGMELKG